MSRTFLDTLPIGLDFSWIVLPKLRKPESDKNIRSVPLLCTLSLAIHPIPVIVSDSVILDGEEAPWYSRMLRLPKITRKSLNSASATISSCPVGQTVVTSKLPELPPVHAWPVKESDQYSVCLFPVTSAAHTRPKAANASLACGGVPVA